MSSSHKNRCNSKTKALPLPSGFLAKQVSGKFLASDGTHSGLRRFSTQQTDARSPNFSSDHRSPAYISKSTHIYKMKKRTTKKKNQKKEHIQNEKTNQKKKEPKHLEKGLEVETQKIRVDG